MAAVNNALDMYCRESGSGFPLVFIHGYLGGGEQWERWTESPPAGLRIVAPCLPGFGDSAHMQPLQSISEFARSVLDFLSSREIEKFFLLGHSMGGMIAQEITKQTPEKIAALVLYGTGALGEIPGRFETMEESRQRVLTEGEAMAAMRLPAKWLVDGKNSPHYSLALKIAEKSGLSSHLAGLNAMESWDGRTSLADITCPTLIVWGELDQSYDRRQIEFLHRNIGGAILRTIPGASHLAHLEFPAQFDDIVSDFLDKVSRSPKNVRL